MDQHVEPFPQICLDDAQGIEVLPAASSTKSAKEQEQIIILTRDTTIDVLEDLDDEEDEYMSAEIRSVFAKHTQAVDIDYFSFCAGQAGEAAFLFEIKSYFKRILKPASPSETQPQRIMTVNQMKRDIRSCLAIGLFSFLHEWAASETFRILTRAVGRTTRTYTPHKLQALLNESVLAREVMEIWRDGSKLLVELIVERAGSTSGIRAEAVGDVDCVSKRFCLQDSLVSTSSSSKHSFGLLPAL